MIDIYISYLFYLLYIHILYSKKNIYIYIYTYNMFPAFPTITMAELGDQRGNSSQTHLLDAG